MTEQSSPREGKVDYRIILILAVLALGNLASNTHRSSRVYLYQQSLCLNHYRSKDPSKIDGQTSVDESLCKIKDVQSPLSIIDGVDAFLTLLPGEVLHLFVYRRLYESVGEF